MDSFYDAPRRPPPPIPRETFSATPVVPEISVLCPSNTPRNPFIPYNQWKKETMPSKFLLSNKENFNSPLQSTQNNSILKKQVRFESPVLQQRPLVSTDPFLNKAQSHLNSNPIGNETNIKPFHEALAVPSFEQMYMANIPHRQLDLSVIDVPKRIPQNNANTPDVNLFNSEIQSIEKEQPKTYREFLEIQKNDNKIICNDSVTDIFNYQRNTNASPKELQEAHRENKAQHSPLSTANVCPRTLKNIRYNQNENNRNTDSEQYIQYVTEAISRRNLPEPYENAYSQGIEQTGGINDIFQKPCIVSQNDDCGDIHLLTEKTGIPSKYTPQVMKNDLINNDFFKKTCLEDTQANQCVETVNKHNYSPNMVTRQIENGYHQTTNQYTATHARHECSTQTTHDLNNSENNALRVRDNNDFSVKDLLKIIAHQSQQISQQNEQLLLLQKQVSTIICRQEENGCSRRRSVQYGQERNCHQQHDRAVRCCNQEQHYEEKRACITQGPMDKNIQDRCITSTQHEDGMMKQSEATPKKNKMPNFSIGLTTSFEVSFRRSHKNQYDHLQKNKLLPDFNGYEPPKIEEIAESPSLQQDLQKNIVNDNRETLVDESIIFKEPIRVGEACVSPEPSIKINMNDFYDSDSEDDLTSPEIGPSFYRNLMVQVNKILQKAQIETTDEVGYNIKGHHLKQDTLHKVKEATLKHLKRIGVEVQNSDDSSQSSNSSDGTDSKSYNQEDISFAVKQLLMKYLPADHLAKVAYQEEQPVNHMLNSKETLGTIKNRPDFSFATIQYMKKYNLIANKQKDFRHAVKNDHPESPKILDITKLKQQPKLL